MSVDKMRKDELVSLVEAIVKSYNIDPSMYSHLPIEIQERLEEVDSGPKTVSRIELTVCIDDIEVDKNIDLFDNHEYTVEVIVDGDSYEAEVLDISIEE